VSGYIGVGKGRTAFEFGCESLGVDVDIAGLLRGNVRWRLPESRQSRLSEQANLNAFNGKTTVRRAQRCMRYIKRWSKCRHKTQSDETVFCFLGYRDRKVLILLDLEYVIVFVCVQSSSILVLNVNALTTSEFREVENERALSTQR